MYKWVMSLVIVLMLASCNQTTNDSTIFLSYFYECSKEQLIKDMITPIANKSKKLEVSDYKILNHFLIPLDELEYKNIYSPTIKNSFEMRYKYRLDHNHYLLSYVEYHGYLGEHTQYLCSYDIQHDKVISKMMINDYGGAKTVSNPAYDGNVFTTTTTYKVNIEKGLDVEHHKDKVLVQKYRLTSEFLFENTQQPHAN